MTTTTNETIQTIWRRDGAGTIRLSLHSGQMRAWNSQRRFIAVLAGKQGGKTSFGPWWLAREINQCGPGDYIAGTASYDLFKLKMLPSLRETFEHLIGNGRYWSGDRILEIAHPKRGFLAKRASDPMWARVILRSAESQQGWASATAKGAWLDEAGMGAFTGQTWEEVQARVALSMGRVLFTTTIYNLGWLKQQIYDRWMQHDPIYDVIQFDSTKNPSFSKAEARRLRSTMAAWKYNMQYRGIYQRPAGLIYDSFDEQQHKVPRFAIPSTWKRHLGLDFGGVNTAGLFYAAEPGTGRYFLYREYHAGGRTAQGHADKLLEGEPMIPICVGGSKSEGQWRAEFRAAGLPVKEPDVKEVEVGIDRVYGAHKQAEIIVFDDLKGYLDQKGSYSRPVDESGEPMEGIENKSIYHFMDAERYIVGWLKRPVQRGSSQSNYLDSDDE